VKRAFVAVACALSCATLVPSCTSGIGLLAPRAMNHPIDVAFACFDTSMADGPHLHPLHECDMAVDVSTNTRVPPTNGYHMHALVTQSTRGEVAAVDLIAHTVLDSDQSVPGYTFVAVGELPTRIVVPTQQHDGSCTFVASRGPVDGSHPGISIIDTRRFRNASGIGSDAVFPRHDPLILPSPPSDMVLSPDETELWVALDDLGVVVSIPIDAPCVLGAPQHIVQLFRDPPPAGVPFVSGPAPAGSADTTRTCLLATPPVPPAIRPPRTPVLDGSVLPMPVALTIDEPNGILLVADRAQPVIHRIQLSDGSLLSPIATGVPVRDVAVTPTVPDSYDLEPDPSGPRCTASRPTTAAITFSRYLYAIDDTDGSVMAIEYSDGTAGTTARTDFGAVIDVDVEGSLRPDRLQMPVIARTLEIITPQFDTTAADPRIGVNWPDTCAAGPPSVDVNGFGLCLPHRPASTVEPGSSTLRGVFLVVATADGGLRLVDIYDLDAPCRGRQFGSGADAAVADCTTPTETGDDAVYIRRHRPRAQGLLTAFISLASGPTVYFPNGGSQLLGNDGAIVGATMASGVPTLVSPITCAPGLAQVWPDPTLDTDANAHNPVVCSVVDPFAAFTESWSAVWQGPIPSTGTTSANAHANPPAPDDPLHSGQRLNEDRELRWVFESRVDYCTFGVIGSADAANFPDPSIAGWGPDVSERNYPQGDVLAITNTLTDEQSMSSDCLHALGISALGQQPQQILLPIERAYSNRPGQAEPYSGELHVVPGSQLVGRTTGFVNGPCDASCGTVDSRDTCDPATNGCMHIPTVEEVLQGCFAGSLLTVEVRSQRAYTVSGSRSGYVARVRRRDSVHDTDHIGACVWDQYNPDPLVVSRAFNGQLFRNTRIQFQPTVSMVPQDLTEIRIVLTGTPPQLALDLSIGSLGGVRGMSLPTHLHYSPSMWALYAVESERRGLIEMTLRPLAVTQTAYQ
jgi:hypothetical protein